MKLTFDILYDSLSKIYSLHRYRTVQEKLHITALRFYTEHWSSNNIYLLENQILPKGFSARSSVPLRGLGYLPDRRVATTVLSRFPVFRPMG